MTVCSLNFTATSGAKNVPDKPTICINITTSPARPELKPLAMSNSGSQVIKVKKIKDCKPINKLTCQANLDFHTLILFGSTISSLTTTVVSSICGIHTTNVKKISTIHANNEPLQPYTSAKGMLPPVPMAANNERPVV